MVSPTLGFAQTPRPASDIIVEYEKHAETHKLGQVIQLIRELQKHPSLEVIAFAQGEIQRLLASASKLSARQRTKLILEWLELMDSMGTESEVSFVERIEQKIAIAAEEVAPTPRARAFTRDHYGLMGVKIRKIYGRIESRPPLKIMSAPPPCSLESTHACKPPWFRLCTHSRNPNHRQGLKISSPQSCHHSIPNS